MRKNRYFLFIFLLTVLSSCKQYKHSLEEFLSYWSAEAFIASDDFSARAVSADTDGFYSVSSTSDAVITLKLHNPKGFSLVMPASGESGKIVTFPQLTGGEPKVGDDYELTQPEKNVLKFTLKKSFLEKYEWGETDISPSFTLYSTDGRRFSQTYTIPLRSNTAPVMEKIALCQTKAADSNGNYYYVFCIKIKDMDKKIGGKLLHRDINAITVNGTKYGLKIKGDGTGFETPAGGAFIAKENVKKIEDSSADDVPESSGGTWVLYYKTDVQTAVGRKTDYTVKLLDNKGLFAELKASTALNKPQPLKLLYKSDDIASGTGEHNPYIVEYDKDTVSIVTLKAKTDTAGVKVIQKTEKKSGGSWTGANTVTGAGNELDINLPAENGAEYKITLKTDATEQFAAAAEKTFYIRLQEQSIEVTGGTKAWENLKKAVAAISAGGTVTIDGTITATSDDGNHGEIVIDKNLTIKKKDGSTSAVINADCSTTGKKHRIFTVKEGVTLTLEGLTLKGGQVEGKDGGAILAERVDGKFTVITATGCTLEGNSVNKGNGGAINASAYSKITLTECIIQNNSVNDGNGGGIHFDSGLYGNKGSLTLIGTTVEGNTVTVSSAYSSVYVGGGGILVNNDSVSVTISGTNAKPSKIIKNKIDCTGSSSTRTPQGCGIWLGSSITAEIKGNVEISDNKTVNSDHGDGGGIYLFRGTLTLEADVSGFPVIKNNSNQKGGGVYICADSTFTMTAGTIEGNTATSAVENGEVQGGGIYSDDSDVTVGKDVVIQTCIVRTTGTNGKAYGGGIYVQGKKDKGVTFNGKITNCTAEATDTNGEAYGGGVHVKHGTFTMNDGTIEENTAKNLGGGVYMLGGEFTMDGGSINKNTVTDSAGKGGGVYLSGNGYNAVTTTYDIPSTFTMKGGTIGGNAAEGNEAQQDGGGVYVGGGGTFNMTGGFIKYNKAALTTSGGNGGGIYIDDGGKATISGSSVIEKNTAQHGNGGGIRVDNGELTVKGTSSIKSNTAGEFGGGVYVKEGTFEMKGGTIGGAADTDKNTAKNGGGVYIGTDTEFTMSNGAISKNTATENGGGVYMVGDTFTMSGGTISGNTVTGGNGGGVYVGTDAEFTMSNGTISGNTATENGGGVYITKGPFNMEGGTISGNKVTDNSGNGSGVYINNGPFTMSGDAQVTPSAGGEANTTGKNDVYLANNQTITITGSLTANPAARITPAFYESGGTGAQVLTGTGVGTDENYKRFKVTKQGTQEWRVKSDGCLEHGTW